MAVVFLTFFTCRSDSTVADCAAAALQQIHNADSTLSPNFRSDELRNTCTSANEEDPAQRDDSPFWSRLDTELFTERHKSLVVPTIGTKRGQFAFPPQCSPHGQPQPCVMCSCVAN